MSKIASLMVFVLVAGLVACASPHALQPPATAASAPAASPLGQLVADDQADRKRQPPISIEEIQQRDAVRRERAMALLSEGVLRTSRDYHDAALIFQHGTSDGDARLAFALATIAARLDPAAKNAAWLAAAAWDRTMMRYRRPQWYGTQYVPSEDGKQWVLYEFDPSPISDLDRAAAGLDKAADIARSFPRQERPAH